MARARVGSKSGVAVSIIVGLYVFMLGVAQRSVTFLGDPVSAADRASGNRTMFLGAVIIIGGTLLSLFAPWAGRVLLLSVLGILVAVPVAQSAIDGTIFSGLTDALGWRLALTAAVILIATILGAAVVGLEQQPEETDVDVRNGLVRRATLIPSIGVPLAWVMPPSLVISAAVFAFGYVLLQLMPRPW